MQCLEQRTYSTYSFAKHRGKDPLPLVQICPSLQNPSLEVCAAISDGTTFEYVKDTEDYIWFLMMANFPFFAGRIEWGVSIRGAWWSSEDPCCFDLSTCGLWEGDRQVPHLAFEDRDDWGCFIAALRHFAAAHYVRLLSDAGAKFDPYYKH